MKQKKFNAKFMAQGAIIAALYAALTILFAPISYGAVQVRISEAFTILPLFTPAAIPGLFIGCLLANILGGAIVWDIIFGSIATLIGAALGYLLRFNRWLVPIPTIVSNSVIIPFILKYGYAIDMPIGLLIVYIAIGEIIGCYLLGELLGSAILRRGDLRNIFSREDKKAKAALQEEYQDFEDDHHDEYDRDL
ncbi:MAG: QueT transporter family protein [Clostridia bacterium]|nr:QueT transporter family protein [Clostridia bacterium]